MSFPIKVREAVLFKCKRHCCLCGEYAGTNLELHHIKQKADGGEDTEDNCIPLCFDCHAEVKQYNPKHPKGLKYTEGELKLRRDEVYDFVKNKVISKYTEDDINLSKKILKNYAEILEYLIKTDPCSQGVYIEFIDEANLMTEELSLYRYNFQDKVLDSQKNFLIESVIEWLNIINNPRYLRNIPDIEYLIFNNATVNEFRDKIYNIRVDVRDSYLKLRNIANLW